MNSCQNKLTISNINKSYDGVQVLKDITMEVKSGELVSILGPSGSGKSTLFNVITNLIKSDSGEVKVNGKVSYMYQKDTMVPWKKVIDNIGIPLVFKGKSKKEARKIVAQYMKQFGLKGFESKYPSMLSGGMKQRANFLKTFLTSNDIMLLDEPFGALDSITRRKLQKWLLNLRHEMNSTILFITHDIDEAILLSDRIYIISDKPAEIKKEIIVDLGEERFKNADLLTVSEKFIDIKKQVSAVI